MGVRRAGREAADKPWVERAGRVGVAMRGVVFLLLAYLVGQVAAGALGGSSTKTAVSGSGVAQAIAARPGGTVLVFLLGVGLACFAALSALEAVLVSESSDAKRWGKRAQRSWRTVVYGAFSAYAFYTAFVPKNSSGSSQKEEREHTHLSAEVLSWPAGRLWLGALGVGLLAGGVYLAQKGVRQKFFDELDDHKMSARTKRLGTITGTVGHLGRAALYIVVGWFVTSAAVHDNASGSQGVDGSLRRFADNAAGATFLYAVAAALAAFGIYMFVEARYRKV